jgi:hypothetical protein
MSGRNLGAGALSLWTHVGLSILLKRLRAGYLQLSKHLKDILYYDNYTTDGYSGPAFKVGAGVQGREIYDASSSRGLMVVGGVCDVTSIHYLR